jgi:hypothetical protein
MSSAATSQEPDLIHRLKNHMCIIVGFCELLISEWPDQDPRRADMVEIHRAAQAAMAMMPEVADRLR